MTSGDPVPAIAEKEATGEVADLYADIRKTLGIPLVNLIWRNLATIPGALPWAWLSIKPLYESGLMHSEALALMDGQQLPDVLQFPETALRVVGVDAQAEAVIRGILASYNRSNPLNLIALSVLLAILRNEISDQAARPAANATPAPLDVTLPALVNLHEISEEIANLVRTVNRLGARGRDHILVSMPRHLAHWPGFLALYWTLISPLDANGDLHRCVDAVRENARVRGAGLASIIGRSRQPSEETRAQIETTLKDFCNNAISRMIPVSSLLKNAMP